MDRIATPRHVGGFDRRHPLAWLLVATLLALAAPLVSATQVQDPVAPSPPPGDEVETGAAREAAAVVQLRSLPAPPTHLPAGLLGGGAHPTGDVPAPPQPQWQALGAALIPGGSWPQVAALARLTFAPGAVLPVDRPAGTILLAVDSGALTVTLAVGEARVGRAPDATAAVRGGTIPPGEATVVAAGDWLTIHAGAVLSARTVGTGGAVAVVSTLVALPVPLKM